MNVLYLNPYNPIPGEGWRESRTSMACQALGVRGHNVEWWTATFSHHFKRQRAPRTTTVETKRAYELRLLSTPGYRGNLSLRRLLFDWAFAMKALREQPSHVPPDVIISPDSIQGTSTAAAILARRYRAKLVLDIFDRWPELFVNVLPAWLRGPARVGIGPLLRIKRRCQSHADAVISLSANYLSQAMAEVERFRHVPATVVYNGIDLEPFRRVRQQVANEVRCAGGASEPFRAVYAGTLGIQYNIKTLLQAARRWNDGRSRPIALTVAGDGPMREMVAKAAAESAGSIEYLGPLDHESLLREYLRCRAGLCTYAAASNVEMPDKAYDYLAAGLPLVNSLTGELAEVVGRERVGVQYEAGSCESLVSAVRSIARDEAMAAAMSENATRLATTFDMTVQYEGTRGSSKHSENPRDHRRRPPGVSGPTEIVLNSCSDLVLHLGNPTDVGRLASLHRRIFEPRVNLTVRLGQRYLVDVYRWFLTAPEAYAVVAEAAGQLAGVTTMCDGPYNRRLLRATRSAAMLGLVTHPLALFHPEMRHRAIELLFGRRTGGECAGDPDHLAFLAYIAVDPAFRGRSVGLSMLAQVETVARARGSRFIRAGIYVENEPSIRMFQKAGYHVLPEPRTPRLLYVQKDISIREGLDPRQG